jgi:hypothetical protein
MNELTPILLEPAPFSLFSHRDRRAERLPPRTVLFAARIRGKTGVSSFFQPIDELTTFPSLESLTLIDQPFAWERDHDQRVTESHSRAAS